MAETDNNRYTSSKRVNIKILGGVPSFYQNLSRYQVSRLLILQLLSSRRYTSSKRVNMKILGGVPSFYQNLSRYQVSRLLILQLLSYVS